MHKARTWNSLVNNERKVGGDTNMMKYLQKLGKALMLPVAALPVAGILASRRGASRRRYSYGCGLPARSRSHGCCR